MRTRPASLINKRIDGGPASIEFSMSSLPQTPVVAPLLRRDLIGWRQEEDE